mmetsp:Transcript_9211/g.15233  ORF Transcript_9211/g.15233 Transcript_9211/m.15233 type:complete len:244 (+) Transcript_9211:119-850(+)
MTYACTTATTASCRMSATIICTLPAAVVAIIAGTRYPAAAVVVATGHHHGHEHSSAFSIDRNSVQRANDQRRTRHRSSRPGSACDILSSKSSRRRSRRRGSSRRRHRSSGTHWRGKNWQQQRMILRCSRYSRFNRCYAQLVAMNLLRLRVERRNVLGSDKSMMKWMVANTTGIVSPNSDTRYSRGERSTFIVRCCDSSDGGGPRQRYSNSRSVGIRVFAYRRSFSRWRDSHVVIAAVPPRPSL